MASNFNNANEIHNTMKNANENMYMDSDFPLLASNQSNGWSELCLPDTSVYSSNGSSGQVITCGPFEIPSEEDSIQLAYEFDPSCFLQPPSNELFSMKKTGQLKIVLFENDQLCYSSSLGLGNGSKGNLFSNIGSMMFQSLDHLKDGKEFNFQRNEEFKVAASKLNKLQMIKEKPQVKEAPVRPPTALEEVIQKLSMKTYETFYKMCQMCHNMEFEEARQIMFHLFKNQMVKYSKFLLKLKELNYYIYHNFPFLPVTPPEIQLAKIIEEKLGSLPTVISEKLNMKLKDKLLALPTNVIHEAEPVNMLCSVPTNVFNENCSKEEPLQMLCFQSTNVVDDCSKAKLFNSLTLNNENKGTVLFNGANEFSTDLDDVFATFTGALDECMTFIKGYQENFDLEYDYYDEDEECISEEYDHMDESYEMTRLLKLCKTTKPIVPRSKR